MKAKTFLALVALVVFVFTMFAVAQQATPPPHQHQAGAKHDHAAMQKDAAPKDKAGEHAMKCCGDKKGEKSGEMCDRKEAKEKGSCCGGKHEHKEGDAKSTPAPTPAK